VNKKVDVNATQFKCSTCGTMNTISQAGRLKAQKNARVGVLIAVGVVGAIVIAAMLNGGNDNNTGTSTNNDLDQRTCEIARDIAGSFNVTDTIARSQQRVAELYSGYGVAASPRIAAGLRQWAAGMTSGNYKAAAAGVTATDAACSAEGF
jgi:hypothetical protein